jgi:hypothetical protein
MPFQVHALAPTAFQPLFALGDAELIARNIRRMRADGRPAFPCRISLQDAAEGESLLLLPHEHHPVDSPYRASGPIYVRENARQAQPPVDTIPELLRRRVLSLRAYDARAMMVWAEVIAGADIEVGIERLFVMRGTDYLHVHYAQPGCYACRIERA